jgi:hypothetical protein
VLLLLLLLLLLLRYTLSCTLPFSLRRLMISRPDCVDILQQQQQQQLKP